MPCKAGPSAPVDCEGSPEGAIEPKKPKARQPPTPPSRHGFSSNEPLQIVGVLNDDILRPIRPGRYDMHRRAA